MSLGFHFLHGKSLQPPNAKITTKDCMAKKQNAIWQVIFGSYFRIRLWYQFP